MIRFACLSLLVALVVSAPLNAGAQEYRNFLGVYGAWGAHTEGYDLDDGTVRYHCYAQQDLSSSRYARLTLSDGGLTTSDRVFLFSVTDSFWTFPNLAAEWNGVDGSTIIARFDNGNNYALRVLARSHTLAVEVEDAFLQDFANLNVLELSFPSGASEQISLIGSERTLAILNDCYEIQSDAVRQINPLVAPN